MKSHLNNVLEELPYILEKEHAVKVLDVDLFKEDTKTGADYRLAAIRPYCTDYLLHTQ